LYLGWSSTWTGDVLSWDIVGETWVVDTQIVETWVVETWMLDTAEIVPLWTVAPVIVATWTN
jgi:hypothetical protein